MQSSSTRRVAVIGGNRIPFARSNTVYADASNQEMLTAAIDGLVDALRARGRAGRRGRRRRRAQALPRLQPDPRVGARLEARRPRPRRTTSSRPAAPASRPRSRSPTRSPSARSRSASPAAPTPPPTRRSRSTRSCARSCSRPTAPRRCRAGSPRSAQGPARATSRPAIPQNGEPRTGLSMGEHAALTALEWQIGREEQDELAAASHQHLAAAYDAGLPRRPGHAVPRARARPEPARRLDAGEARHAQAGLRQGRGRHDDRRQLHAADRRRVGRAAGLGGVGRGARPAESLAYLTDYETAAVDFVHGGEGLLMAPAYAMPRMLAARRADAAGLRLLRDPRGVRLAGAGHAQGVGGPDLLQGAARPRRAARRDRPRQAQRQRLVAGGRPPVRRHRRPDRRQRWPSCSPRRAPAAA